MREMEYVKHSDDAGRKNTFYFLCILCIITTRAEEIPMILEVSTF